MVVQNEQTHKTVARLMTTRVVSVEMDDSLEMVQDIFRKVKFHHLLVVEQGVLVGIISDRDLLKAVSPYVGTMSETSRDRATLQKRAHQIMAHHPTTIRSFATIHEAAQLMIKRGVSCLPVLSKDRKVLGVITWKDLLKGFLEVVP